MKPERKKYWIASLEGVREITGEPYVGSTRTYVIHGEDAQGAAVTWQVLDTEAFETKQEAIIQAKKMITKKLASIDKQLASIDKQRAKLLKMAEELAK